MIDFLWGLAGGVVAVIAVSLIVACVLPAVPGIEAATPTRGDKVIGFIVGVVAVIVFSGVVRGLVDDPSEFVDNLGLGAGIAVMISADTLIARIRGHGSAPSGSTPLGMSSVREGRPDRFVVPAVFSHAVQRRLSSPEARARYVVAAYRRGLIPGRFVPGLAAELAPLLPFPGAPAWNDLGEHVGDGLDGAVDRAARAIDYIVTPEQEWADAVERLVYTAMSGSDPAVRRATAELLVPPLEPVAEVAGEADRRRYDRWQRAEELRARIADAYNARYEAPLDDAVHRRFGDPTVCARHLIAAYRHELIRSDDVPRAAAAFFADLPGSGEAWTELAMAPNDAWRSDLDPIVDRAAVEIGYDADEAEESVAIVEMAAYRAVVDDDVMGQGEPLWDKGYRAQVPGAYGEFLDVHGTFGFDVSEQLARIRSDLATRLNDRYG
ncbi:MULTISPECIES: hypothetical protein [Tsukamurella]|uniref:Uncharacterized protein n=2 Tax=Tsukamurella TaxID=2060 RepID=A0A5C5RVU7_9ACTN|nr:MULTISPECIES: hypothetical protein [Tsukamurella]NMD54042.1 hypothetical protein [Tsukamurella columbiensis]TWS27127.1 hypothetical protein FK530_20105 [Tsukamurella conjunctivitidis]